MARSRGTVRHLCRDKDGRPLRGKRLTRRGEDGTPRGCISGCRDGVWCFAVRLDAQRYMRRSGFKTKTDAVKALEAARGQDADGLDPMRRVPTVSEWLDEWLVLRRHTRRREPARESTLGVFRHLVEAHLRPHLGGHRLDHLRLVHVEAMFDAIEARNVEVLATRPNGRVVGLAAQNRIVEVLRSALNLAVREGYLRRSPLGDYGRPHYEPAEKKTWNGDQLNRFLDAAEGDRLAPMLALLTMYALRRSEAIALRWSDVDLDAGRLHIRFQLEVEHVGSGAYVPTFKAPKTRKSRRSFALDPGTVADLREHRRRQLAERLRAGSAWQDHDLIFCRADGSPVPPHQVNRRWNELERQANVPHVGPHGGRHTGITLGLMEGVPLKVMSERAGHASTRITADLYAHVLDEHDAAAAQAIGSLRRRAGELR